MLRRRRKLSNWPPKQLAAHVLLGRSSYWEGEEGEASIRAGLLLHQNPELLPRRVSTEDGFFEYVVLDYFGDVHNIVAYRMGTVEDMLNEIHGFQSETEAQAFIRDNYPEPDLSYAELPQIIMSAFIHGTRDTQPPLG